MLCVLFWHRQQVRLLLHQLNELVQLGIVVCMLGFKAQAKELIVEDL